MEAYGKFAQVYDLFMDNVDYEKWADYIEKHLKESGNRRRAGFGPWLRNRSYDGIACAKRI